MFLMIIVKKKKETKKEQLNIAFTTTLNIRVQRVEWF